MKYPLFAILLALFVFGCHEKLPDIEPVILHESDLPLFEVDSVVVLSLAPQINIRVYFSTRFEELTEEQKSEISRAIVTRNGEVIHSEFLIDRTDVPADTILFFEDIITEKVITCYEAFFRGGFSNSAISSRPTEICVDMRPGVLIFPMELSEDSLFFGYLNNTKTFRIINTGFNSFKWNFNPAGASFLSLNVLNDSLNGGESIDVTLEVDRTDLVTAVHLVNPSIENDRGDTLFIPVNIPHYNEEKWLISGQIIDAEYDKIDNDIIAVSEFPNEIRKFDPTTKSIETLNLNNNPTCLSISQNGQFAAVGHNTGFYYVNLASMELLDDFSGIGNTFDIILGPNNWVYLFLDPPGSSSIKIQCINLDNGQVVESIGGFISEKSTAKLHPSGNYIYSTSTTSGGTIYKHDITDGIAQYLYDRNTGVTEGVGNFWVSPDGDRIFLDNKMVFNSSPIQNDDISLIGELESRGIGNRLQTLDCFENKINAVILTSEIGADVRTDDNVQNHRKSDLSFRGQDYLPRFFYGSNSIGLYDPYVHYGFFRSDGEEFYALATWEKPNSEPSNEWAIITK